MAPASGSSGHGEDVEDCAPQADLPLHLLIQYLIIDCYLLDMKGCFENSSIITGYFLSGT